MGTVLGFACTALICFGSLLWNFSSTAVCAVLGMFMERPKISSLPIARDLRVILWREIRFGSGGRLQVVCRAVRRWRVTTVWECAANGRVPQPIKTVADACLTWLESDKREV